MILRRRIWCWSGRGRTSLLGRVPGNQARTRWSPGRLHRQKKGGIASPSGLMTMAGGQVHLSRKAPCEILMKNLVKLSQRAAALVASGRAGHQSLRASTTSTKLTRLINQDQKVAGKEKGGVHLPEGICLEEIVRPHHQPGIGMIGTRGAQASWAVFLMTAFVMTGMTGAQAAWSAPHIETVLVTMIAETAVHIFHLDIEFVSPTSGITRQVVLIIPLVGGVSMRISETVAHFIMTDRLLSVLGLPTAMKQPRRTEMSTTQKRHSTKANQRSNLQRPRVVVAMGRLRRRAPKKRQPRALSTLSYHRHPHYHRPHRLHRHRPHLCHLLYRLPCLHHQNQNQMESLQKI